MSPGESLASFPGAALRVSPDGVVLESNGQLETRLGRGLVGTRFADVLDPTAQAKWTRILGGPPDPACRWELLLAGPEALEVRTFLAVPAGGASDQLLLLEQGGGSEPEAAYQEISDLNRELIEAQRGLARERRRLERALEETERAVRSRDDVLAIVSHDLRNPLSAITTVAELLELPLAPEKRAEQVDLIKRSARSALKLIADLLDVSAFEAGRVAMELEAHPLPPVIAEACRMAELEAKDRGVRLECVVAAESVLRVDRHRLLQVLSNLLGNAIKFTPSGGTVRLDVVERGADLVASVSDTGPGIPPAELPHVFDRFWQARRRRRGGAGLGLAIAKGLVEAHGGTVGFECPEGGGSTFWIMLPVH